MDEEQFWAIVAAAREVAGDDVDARVEALEQALEALSLEEIQGFQTLYDEMIARANRWDLWGAAYLMNDGCSDDGFRYFRDWLVSEGRETFEQALADPDSLASVPALDYFELEAFGYAAGEVHEAKGGGELERNLSAESAEPAGQEWDEEDLPAMLPRLAEVYGD